MGRSSESPREDTGEVLRGRERSGRRETQKGVRATGARLGRRTLARV